MPGPKRQPIEVRFAAYLIKRGDDECWGWKGPVIRGGHPVIGIGGQRSMQVSARQIAYRLFHGREPEEALHPTCGASDCLNPKHLALSSEKCLLTLRQRLESKIRRRGEDECWPWLAKTSSGYGYISRGQKRGAAPAHRVVWELTYGPIPEGLLIRQRCGNRLCCNPAHLFLALNAVDSPEASAAAVENWRRLTSACPSRATAGGSSSTEPSPSAGHD
jgi:hypothetical protein